MLAADEDQLKDKICMRAVDAGWLTKSPEEKRQVYRSEVLKSLLELVPQRLIEYAKKGKEVSQELLPEQAGALSKHRIWDMLCAEHPLQLQQACDKALSEWNKLVKKTSDCTGKIAKKFEPGGWPVARSVEEKLPELAALEVVQQGRQKQEVMEVLKSVLKAAHTEGQMLKESDLLKLTRQVAETVSMEAASELHDPQKSPDAIAKVLTGEFFVPALMAKTEEARKLSDLELQHLHERSIEAIRNGKGLMSAVQETLKSWQKTRAEIDACTQTIVTERLPAFVLDWKRVSTSAIANVLGGAQVRMAVDSAVTQERVLAAIRAAASSLDDQIDDSQVEKLQVGLAGRISSSPDDTKLLEEAKRLVSTALDESQSNKQEHMILEAIRLATRHHPLSVKESNEVVVRVTKAMAEGAALDIAVLDALPKSQAIWDTKENTAMRGDGNPKFVPFVSKQNKVPGC